MKVGIFWSWCSIAAWTAVACSDAEPEVVRDLIEIAAPAPPDNPVTGRATPAHLNRARFLRYRKNSEPGAVRAIVICMPGVPAGAMAFDVLARKLVALSDGEVEVWSMDRRANLLEDLTGMQEAERLGDPDLAWQYYDEKKPLSGRTYAGAPKDHDYMSEWGLATAISDLRAIMGLVPKAERRQAVILLGHSFGAALVQAASVWDFEGRPLSDELAGLVVVDGGLHLYKQLSQDAYLNKGSDSVSGLQDLRKGRDLYLGYYGFGLEAFMATEITALRAWLSPRAVVKDEHVKRFATLIFLRTPPPLTAAAAVGFTLDDDSSPLPGMRASCGTGLGPLESFLSPLSGELRLRPKDATRLYDWLDYDRSNPREKTSIMSLAHVAHEGPTNRLEWFFPGRLLLDVPAISQLSATEGGWQWSQGLRATRARDMDAPVMVVQAGKGLVPSLAAHARFRAAIAPFIGAGRPGAGAGRDATGLASGGFADLTLPDYAHDDLVHATVDAADGQLWRPLLSFMLHHTRGERTIPLTGVVP